MSLLERLQHLMPRHRRAREDDMRAELASLASMAEPGELGNLTRAAEEARAVWTWSWLEQAFGDAKYCLRTLRKNPSFTATAVLSLALGIGANTAIFSLIDALMLRQLPVRDPQELVQVKMRVGRDGSLGDTFSYAIANALAEQKEIFAAACGFTGTSLTVGPRGSVTRVQGAWVTGGYYETLGLNPTIGRLLTTADDRPGAPLVGVLSYGYWERQFGRSPQAVGQSVYVNGVPVEIVGVSPAGFSGANVGTVADITLAVAALPRLEPTMASLLGPGNFWLRILARPRKGIPVTQATARLAVEWPGIAERVISRNWPASQRKEVATARLELTPGGTGHTRLRTTFGKPLMVLLAVTGLVLVIACGNVASLLLARANARRREISVRLAIGAGRTRIIRQLLTESVVLSSLGAVVGMALAWITSRILVDTLSTYGGSAVLLDVTPNGHVLAFTIAVSVATGILFGLAPAFRSTGKRAGVVKDDTRMASSGSRFLSGLVSAQVALSFVLLVGAGLFVGTLRNLLNVDPGFRREGVLLVEVDGRKLGYKDAALSAFYKELVERVRRIPGVSSASIASHTPLSGSQWSEAIVPKGQTLPDRDNALVIAAGPQFLATMQTPLIAGREFDARDEGRMSLAIVNESYAARFFPGRNPLGQYVSARVTTPPSDLEIVGVVKDATTRGLRLAPYPTVYVPFFQRGSGSGTLEIRAAGSLSQVAQAIRKELQPTFPDTPLEVRGLSEQVEQTLVQERLMATLAAGFGILGVLLACTGLHGLLAYSVVRRTKEIGVRMALGAQQRGVLWMVGGGALRLVAAGMLLGLPCAWMATRWVKSMLFGLTPTDPRIAAAALLLLIAAALAAAYVPARRAARVDPMTALRHE